METLIESVSIWLICLDQASLLPQLRRNPIPSVYFDLFNLLMLYLETVKTKIQFSIWFLRQVNNTIFALTSDNQTNGDKICQRSWNNFILNKNVQCIMNFIFFTQKIIPFVQTIFFPVRCIEFLPHFISATQISISSLLIHVAISSGSFSYGFLVVAFFLRKQTVYGNNQINYHLAKMKCLPFLFAFGVRDLHICLHARCTVPHFIQ